MIPGILSVIILAFQGPPAPVTASSGNVVVRVPEGWKFKERGEELFLQPSGLEEDGEFVVIVLAGRKAEGNLAEEAERSWNQVAGRKKVVAKAPGRETRTESGVEGILAVGILEPPEGRRLIVTLAVFKPGDRAETVVALATQERTVDTYREPLGRLLRDLRFRNVELPAYELLLWLPPGDAARTPEVRILWRDGTLLATLPQEGLDGFEPAASRARFEKAWGTHETQGGVLRLRRGDRWESLEIQPDGSYRSPEGERVVRVDPMTARTLEGRFVLRGGSDAAPAPSLVFKPDGTFEDRGGCAAFLGAGEFPATGRYVFANHTLRLSYQDAPPRRTSALVLPGTGGSAAGDLLLGGRWFRRDGR